jgi:hypothetical protein
MSLNLKKTNNTMSKVKVENEKTLIIFFVVVLFIISPCSSKMMSKATSQKTMFGGMCEKKIPF